jgi:hypothetical protein
MADPNVVVPVVQKWKHKCGAEITEEQFLDDVDVAGQKLCPAPAATFKVKNHYNAADYPTSLEADLVERMIAARCHPRMATYLATMQGGSLVKTCSYTNWRDQALSAEELIKLTLIETRLPDNLHLTTLEEKAPFGNDELRGWRDLLAACESYDPAADKKSPAQATTPPEVDNHVMTLMNQSAQDVQKATGFIIGWEDKHTDELNENGILCNTQLLALAEDCKKSRLTTEPITNMITKYRNETLQVEPPKRTKFVQEWDSKSKTYFWRETVCKDSDLSIAGLRLVNEQIEAFSFDQICDSDE